MTHRRSRASDPALTDSTRHAFLSYARSSECEVDKRRKSQRNISFGEDHGVNLQTGPAIPWFRRNAASDGKSRGTLGEPGRKGVSS